LLVDAFYTCSQSEHERNLGLLCRDLAEYVEELYCDLSDRCDQDIALVDSVWQKDSLLRGGHVSDDIVPKPHIILSLLNHIECSRASMSFIIFG